MARMQTIPIGDWSERNMCSATKVVRAYLGGVEEVSRLDAVRAQTILNAEIDKRERAVRAQGDRLAMRRRVGGMA